MEQTIVNEVVEVPQNGSVPAVRPPTNSGAGGEAAKARGVCVTLPANNRPQKMFSDSPLDFLPSIKNSSLTWINFGVKDMEKDAPLLATTFGFSESLVPTLLKGYYSNFEDRDHELGLMVPAVRVIKLELVCYSLLVLVRKGLILTIHTEEVMRIVNFSRYADAFIRKLPESMPAEDKLSLMLVRILDENNSRNFEQLREIEDQADWLAESLLNTKVDRNNLGRNIYELKHTLIVYLNTLWRSLDVLNSIRYGDAALITDNPKVLAKVNMLVEDVNQQISLSEHMSDVMASGLEVLQSIYNNQLQILNNRMALAMTWLTILGTAVLVPNTLATIGGMLSLQGSMLWWYIGVIIIATVFATFLAYWWVTQKVSVPVRADEWSPAKESKHKAK
jgi:magnesium transporter